MLGHGFRVDVHPPVALSILVPTSKLGSGTLLCNIPPVGCFATRWSFFRVNSCPEWFLPHDTSSLTLFAVRRHSDLTLNRTDGYRR